MAPQAPDREKALELALAQIEKNHGKGSVMRLGDEVRQPISVIPTGSIALDVALGLGGLPRGRVVEIYGPESSGKTTVALHAVANAQAAGGIAAFIDAEHALDPEYAKKLGVDTDSLLVSQPDTGEQALEIADMLIRSGALDILVIDSVAALVPRAEIEGEMGDSHVGLQARLMSQALRKITGALSNSGTTAIFINQLREKIGVMFGSPETTTGGKALKFYASVRLDVRRIETLKDGTDAVGNRTRVKVVKNKCLAEGTRIFDPVTGTTHRIEDVVNRRKQIHVVAAAKDGTLHSRPVVSWFDQGTQDVIGLRIAGGPTVWATPDHKVLTEYGWRQAGELRKGDRVAQPRRFDGFGNSAPISGDQARLLGYLIGDGYVGGKTPINFINVQQALMDDVTRIAATLGCAAHPQGRISLAITHRPGERNGVLELCRRAGIHGKLAWEKTIPNWFFEPDIAADIVGNLLFGLLESDGWVSREQTGALRVGYTTTSEQLAHQIHWLLMRFGIVSTVRDYDPTQRRASIVNGRRVQSKRQIFEVRISGMDNVTAFADAVPMWGPRGTALVQAMPGAMQGRRRGSQATYLAAEMTDAVLNYLEERGVTTHEAAAMIGEGAGDPRGGMKQVLGVPRLRRDRLQALADTLDDKFLHDVLAEELRYSVIREVLPVRRARTFDLEVEELHNLVAEGVVVHNCSPPFKQAEFDILYGKGISREGSLIDMGVEQGFIRKSGSWFTYEGEQLGQGKENARNFLLENVDVANEIEKKIKEKLGIGAVMTDDSNDDVLPAPVDF
ncbi:intein-containing recombinase RecA [Mycolicibacterium holsaticum]|uniref:intein-containing recombinase RecA n=1 Tax=Mycolicibacterium holsaticum TaxID=152142 RepID=UPI001C7E0A85|nr:intein-containing recombinase RecA [Mycolicibacterium holsaticum]QZA10726.1 intein-containing recombinase RecA [Mycolicibacterium holsaticum DSM 44478 = JCM 12374]UNC11774.1 intein-containing recombinase RecA [Mycolicibacterium holsaticum DSM 44478 = JCM 12374]